MAPSQKWKAFERETSRRVQEAAGKIVEPKLRPLVTSTGRVGPIYQLGFDTLVGEGAVALAGECKRKQVFLGAEALRALLQVFRISVDWGRQPFLAFQIPDAIPTFVEVGALKTKKVRVVREWVVCTRDYFIELIYVRRFVQENYEDEYKRWKSAQKGVAK